MFSCAVFDLDGTLANTLNSISHFGNSALKSMSLPGIDAAAYKELVGDGADMLMRRMLKRSLPNYSEENVKMLRAEYDRLYEAEPMYLVTSYDGLGQVLERVSACGVKLGVISNKPDNVTKRIVKKLYRELFAEVQGQIEGVPKKPDPFMLINMLSVFRVNKSDVLYIGDSGVDMQTGRNAGVKTCGVLWGFRSEEELMKNGADFIISKPSELEALILR